MPSIKTSLHGSLSELTNELSKSGMPYILLGTGIDSPREFVSLEALDGDRPRVGIGILSLGIGIKPGWRLHDEILIVGFNVNVVAIDLKSTRVVRETDLLTLFWEFISFDGSDLLYAVCESGIVAITREADVVWRVDIDRIVDYQQIDHWIDVQLADDPPVRINLLTGKITHDHRQPGS